MDIEERIKNMSMRPGMYVSPINVFSIENYLGGYLSCFKGDINTYKFDYASVNCVFSSFIDRWIYQWIIQNIDANYDNNDAIIWSYMISDVTKDEKEAVELFFSLCEKFFEDFHNKDESFWEGLSF